MSIHKKRQELLRLQQAFELEAAQFHDLSLSVLFMTQQAPATSRAFNSPNHAIMLWQYYGELQSEKDTSQFLADLTTSDTQRVGLRGSEFSCFAILEGPRVAHFIKMANRAASLFSEKEKFKIQMHAQSDFETNGPQRKYVFVANSNSLAVWLNYVLVHLGRTHPRRASEVRIDLDPFAASLSAIDQLLETGSVSPGPRPPTDFELTHFRVALSFPGEKRSYVEQVAEALSDKLGTDAIFYDNYYQPQLARPNLDVLLQRIYRDNSELIVTFLCADYVEKQWCGLEWRAIRDIIKHGRDDKVMLLRFDNTPIPGLFSIDGYLDVSDKSPTAAADAILTRLGMHGTDA